jgi:hypothetical protein
MEKMNETFRLYSLFDQENRPLYELEYTYIDPESPQNSFETTLYISEKLEIVSMDSNNEETKEYIYYIYSPAFDIIAEFKPETLFWVEWDLLNYMDTHTYSVSIDNVASMQIVYDKMDVLFTLNGTGDVLTVSSNKGTVDTQNFRQLYKAIVFSTMDGYADEPEGQETILQLKIKLRDGSVYHYEFYPLTARKAYYSLNGSGQFYINRDYVKQIIGACGDLLAGKDVVVEHKN